jgi:predicted transposase YdaD
MPYVSSGERIGRKAGREEGLKEGRQEGQAQLLSALLERRFGALDEELRRRVASAGMEELQRWALNFVGAASLQDVFRDA